MTRPKSLRSLALMALVFAATSACGQEGESKDPAKKDPPVPAASADPIATLQKFIDAQKIDKSRSDWKERLPMPPKAEFDPAKKAYLTFETSHGTMKIRFFPEAAPMHVSSTMYLALLGFFDGIVFHRVIPGFMAQGGCPKGTGTGSPGYNYDGECRSDYRHDRPGILSMANTGRPKSDGSQFFLTFRDTPHLDMKHTVFGEVVEGMEVLRKLESLGTPSGATKERIAITKATVSVQ